jgi:hypothetical protein
MQRPGEREAGQVRAFADTIDGVIALKGLT